MFESIQEPSAEQIIRQKLNHAKEKIVIHDFDFLHGTLKSAEQIEKQFFPQSALQAIENYNLYGTSQCTESDDAAFFNGMFWPNEKMKKLPIITSQYQYDDSLHAALPKIFCIDLCLLERPANKTNNWIWSNELFGLHECGIILGPYMLAFDTTLQMVIPCAVPKKVLRFRLGVIACEFQAQRLIKTVAELVHNYAKSSYKKNAMMWVDTVKDFVLHCNKFVPFHVPQHIRMQQLLLFTL